MLRPAKLFHSLHQLRHYVQTKVTELVVAQHPPPFLLPNPTAATTSSSSSANAITPWAYQRKPLTNGLQRQFPMINKACSPLIIGGGGGHLPSWRPLVGPAASAWHRGISLGLHGNSGGLGAFRSYSSSTVSPFFQAYHSATSSSSTHTSVFSHFSSSIFAPLANTVPSTKSNNTTCQRRPILPPQQKQPFQQVTMGVSNKYKTSQHLINVPTPTTTTTTTVKETAIVDNNDMVMVPPTAMTLCTEDELTTDMHSVTVPTTQTCFYITLNLVPTTLDWILNHSTTTYLEETSMTPWTKDVWPMFVKWKERQQDYYERLLTWLQPCLDKGYRIQFEVGNSSLRLYFPKQVTRRDQALIWLDELKDVKGGGSGGGDKMDGFLTLVELQEETISVDEPLAPLGPDYFQGIHLFLSHIDNLVDHGPAFAQSSSVSV